MKRAYQVVCEMREGGFQTFYYYCRGEGQATDMALWKKKVFRVESVRWIPKAEFDAIKQAKSQPV